MNVIRNAVLTRTEYFDPENDYSFVKLGNALIKMMMEADARDREIVIFCIGTDRATGDALGPLVGDFLTHHSANINVAGTLKNPIHALNMRENINNLYSYFDDPFVIAVDASLGIRHDIGMVTLTNSHIYPGKGVNKKLPAIGDISITGIVNMSGHTGTGLLQSTRLYMVKNMSDCISQAIIYAFNYLSIPL